MLLRTVTENLEVTVGNPALVSDYGSMVFDWKHEDLPCI